MTRPLDLADLHPDLAEKVRELQARAATEGIYFVKTSGARGFAKQATLYTAYQRSPKDARTKYGVVAKPAPMGLTRHHPYFGGKAAAVDLAVTGIAAGAARDAAQRLLGLMAEDIGLVWGWRADPPGDPDGDPVHFELKLVDGMPIDTAREYIRLGERLDRIAGYLTSTPPTSTPPLPGGGA